MRKSGFSARGVSALYELFREAGSRWLEDNAPRLGAALAYYTIFSLAPLLIIVTGVSGLAFGPDAARGQVIDQLRGLVGEPGAEAIQSMLASASKPSSGIIATAIGLATLVLGATGVFGELQSALNDIWKAPPLNSGLARIVKLRIIYFGMVIGIGFLLLVSLVLSATLAAVAKFVGEVLPVPPIFLQAADNLLSLTVITFLFAMIYRVLPDVRIEWSDVWVGAALTAVLFTLGKFAIGLYLGQSSVASLYGAAGSLVVLIVWIYYSSQIFFFGAELTRAYAARFGSYRYSSPTPRGTEESRLGPSAPPPDAPTPVAPLPEKAKQEPMGGAANWTTLPRTTKI